MPIVYRLTPEILAKLKAPFGVLIRGSFTETMSILEDRVKREKPPKIITVGDVVSRNLHEHNIIPQLAVIDNICMRKKVDPRVFPDKKLIHVKNPKGTITEEAIIAVQDALKNNKQTQILVEGEEDMLTLIAVAFAPVNSFVVYGQPKEGIVLIKVTPMKKTEANQILEAMKPVQTK
jgi:uncharacterized protein (UPF0218 family)